MCVLCVDIRQVSGINEKHTMNKPFLLCIVWNNKLCNVKIDFRHNAVNYKGLRLLSVY